MKKNYSRDYCYSDIDNIRKAQMLAKKLAWEIADNVEVGMNENDVRHIAFKIFLANGIRYHWHIPYIGLGQGTNKLKSKKSLYMSLFSRGVKLGSNDLILIDIAPIIEGYPSDFTVSKVVGQNKSYNDQILFTKQMSSKVLEMVKSKKSNSEIFNSTKNLVSQSRKYVLGEVPIVKLGHRIIKLPEVLKIIPEGRFASLFFYPGASFLNGRWNAGLDKIWAIEPYILSDDRGTKYEELIYVEEDGNVIHLNPPEEHL